MRLLQHLLLDRSSPGKKNQEFYILFLPSYSNIRLGERKRNWGYFSLPIHDLYCCKLAYLNICKMKVRLCSWDWVHRTGVGVWLEEVSLYFNGYCKGFPREFFRWKLFFCRRGAQSLIIALAFAAQHICYCRGVSPPVDFYNAIKISRLTKQRRLETLWGRKGKGREGDEQQGV